jgi:hypothetical protein
MPFQSVPSQLDGLKVFTFDGLFIHWILLCIISDLESYVKFPDLLCMMRCVSLEVPEPFTEEIIVGNQE